MRKRSSTTVGRGFGAQSGKLAGSGAGGWAGASDCAATASVDASARTGITRRSRQLIGIRCFLWRADYANARAAQTALFHVLRGSGCRSGFQPDLHVSWISDTRAFRRAAWHALPSAPQDVAQPAVFDA